MPTLYFSSFFIQFDQIPSPKEIGWKLGHMLSLESLTKTEHVRNKSPQFYYLLPFLQSIPRYPNFLFLHPTDSQTSITLPQFLCQKFLSFLLLEFSEDPSSFLFSRNTFFLLHSLPTALMRCRESLKRTSDESDTSVWREKSKTLILISLFSLTSISSDSDLWVTISWSHGFPPKTPKTQNHSPELPTLEKVEGKTKLFLSNL